MFRFISIVRLLSIPLVEQKVTRCELLHPIGHVSNFHFNISYISGSGTLFRFLVITSQLAVRHFFLRYLMYLRAIRIRTPTESEDEDPRFFYP